MVDSGKGDHGFKISHVSDSAHHFCDLAVLAPLELSLSGEPPAVPAAVAVPAPAFDTGSDDDTVEEVINQNKNSLANLTSASTKGEDASDDKGSSDNDKGGKDVFDEEITMLGRQVGHVDIHSDSDSDDSSSECDGMTGWSQEAISVPPRRSTCLND